MNQNSKWCRGWRWMKVRKCKGDGDDGGRFDKIGEG